ncbi:hypothetical protein lacNasYZ03_05360 [Lactobacillus nasalidis]|uniref:NlpC/P60 domain-containing protein n=1 Tax=Lactobacillus nasalidis TaxID=2797258 RepID=A0ABQ3W6X8_9LACO|nr:phage tail tape measure protein [Lactobacillus nasalidis]GHV97322.1 hypothetical protein lacNasYZ01_05040 [Lactobacillus nasalidis]GHV99918.1 hypothetical protein lacNasYZ02_13480 [Lactobacillus nasalidis]GHW00849.1 hypothetical protein lacNasYZ03_05360 [Lactobacillus nasalidis]
MGAINSIMATEVKIGTEGSTKSLKQLENAIKATTYAWKSQAASAKNAGQLLKSAETRYDGITKSISQTQEKIKILEARQKECDRTTESGANAYAKYESKLIKARQSLETLTNQQQKAARSLEYQKSGLGKLQQAYSSSKALSESYVARLEAEGKKYEATKERAKQYAGAVKNLDSQLQIQRNELDKIADTSGKASQAYRSQQIRINKTATAVAEYKTKLKQAQDEQEKIRPTGFNRLVAWGNKAKNATDKLKSGLSKVWDEVKSSAAVAATGVGALTTVAISGAKKAQDLQQSYKEINNLLVSGGEKQAQVTKAVKEMQRQGQEMSIKYGKSQQQIAEGYEELVKRGYTSEQALGAMRTELEGSVASGDKFSDVVTVSSQVLEGFGLKVKSSGNSAKDTATMLKNTKTVVNELAYAADMTSTGFSDLGVGMSYVSSIANQSKLSLAETASAMGVLSNNGLEADKAGTGLRKVIQSLGDAIGKIGSKNSVLTQLGIKKSELVDANGNMKDLATCFSVINKHTKGMSTVEKGTLFKSLFGTTGSQAGQILAENVGYLKELTGEVDKAGKKGSYVSQLATKNSATAKQAQASFKQSAEAFKMTLGTAMLPAIRTASKELSKFLLSKDGEKFQKNLSKWISKVANDLVKLIEWASKNTDTIKSFGKAVAGIFVVTKALKFVSALHELKKSLGEIKAPKWLGKMTKPLSTTLKSVGKDIKWLGKETATGFKDVAKRGGKAFLRGLKGIGSGAKKLGKKAGSSLVKGLKTVNGKIKSWASSVGGYLKDNLSKGVSGALKGESFGGAFQSLKSAKATGGLSTAGKLMTGAAAAGVAADSISTLYSAFKNDKKGSTKKFKDVGSGIGSAIGGGIGLYFGGPLGAALGSQIGKVMGGVAGKGAKSFQKGWNKNKPPKKFWSMENFGYSTHNFFKGIKSGLTSFGKWWDKKWKFIKKGFSNTWIAIREAPGKAWKKINKSWDSFWSSFNKSFKNSWNKIKKFFSGLWDDIIKMPAKAWKKISSGFESFSKDFKKTWRSLGKGIQDIWDTAWGKIKKLAHDGVAGIVKVINTGIGGIDTVIAAFGGSKTAIKKIQFATGTGAFSGPRRAITKPTLAMLNDGNDSPETGNKEMIWRPSTGEAGIVQGRNTTAMLMPGDEVFNASETKSLMVMAGIEHFAKGTGVLSGIASWAEGVGSWIGQKASALMKWFKKATAIIANPAKALSDVFKTSTKGLKGVMVELGQGMMKSAKNAATSWWSTLWSMASDKLGGSGSASGLLSAVEKYGSGKPYVWGATGPESFDCSGLVMYALKKAFGISYPHYSGSQYAASTHISKSQAKPGDLVFWGSGGSEHVGVYAGSNSYYSAQSPSQGIGMNTLSSVVGKGSPLFARVPGLKDTSSSSKKSAKGSSKLQSMIKEQVGSGFWKFLAKLGSLFGSEGEASGGSFSPSMIRDAAKQMHVTVSDSFVRKLQAVIQNESGGRTIVQQIHDVNSGGNEARGILQYTPSTFAAYAVSGHKNIMSPYDQLLAFFNNSDWKNSIGWTTIWGTRKLDWLHSGPQGHRRYANGGLVTTEQLAHVAEGNKPEMIIPLDIAKRSRANQLLTQVQARFAAESPQTAENSQSTDSKELFARMDKMLALLGMLLKGQGDMEVTLDGQKLGKVLKKQQTIEDMRTALLYG